MNRESRIKAAALALAEATEDMDDGEAMAVLKLARRIRREQSGNKKARNH